MTSARRGGGAHAGAFGRFVARLFRFGEPEAAGEVLGFRLLELYVLAQAAYWAWSWGFFIQAIPAVLVPHGLARHLDLSFLVGGPLALWNAALVTLCAAGALWPRGARFCLPVLLVLLHVQYVARHSLGKVAHGSQYVGLGLWCLALAAWCVPAPADRRRFALGATRFFMGAGYLCAALSKLAARGLAWPDGRHLWLWIGEKSVDELSDLGQVKLNMLQQLCLDHWWLATAFLSLGLLAELAGFLLWFPPTRPLITLALIGLHLGIFWTLGILFEAYIIQLAIVGLPLPQLFGWALARYRGASSSSIQP